MSGTDRLCALALIAIAAAGCTTVTLALAGKPEPYAGRLQYGQLVRAIVEDFSPSFIQLAASHRRNREESAIEEISFTNAPGFKPAAGGTMVVFRVIDSWNYHTPDDASGMHEWISVYNSELIAVELSEAEAIAAARTCLQDPASHDTDNPFAFGPGARGGWIVRFAKLALSDSTGTEIELDRAGRCAER